jgi:hypothetical protein
MFRRTAAIAETSVLDRTITGQGEPNILRLWCTAIRRRKELGESVMLRHIPAGSQDRNFPIMKVLGGF